MGEEVKCPNCEVGKEESQEVILLEVSHRLELSEAQKEMARRLKAVQKDERR